MEGTSLEKKLLGNLTAAFLKDPNIDEYDFLPVLEPINNSNPIVTVDHKLGIELWAAKILFNYAYKKLMCVTTRRKGSAISDNDYEDLLPCTCCILMMNPDCLTAWNLRKELVKAEKLLIKDDLHFGKLILGKHPKSPETFSHRKWLMSYQKQELCSSHADDRNRNMNSHDQDMADGPYLLSLMQETQVAQKAADKYANNYNAWNYRIWVLDSFNAQTDILLTELATCEKWVVMHVSDHSGFHYRQNLLGRLHRLGYKDYLYLMHKELSLTAELITRYEGHEAVWYHRRWIVHSLQCALSPENIERDAKRCRLDTNEQQTTLDSEKSFCSHIRSNCCHEWQLELLNRHEKWMDRSVL